MNNLEIIKTVENSHTLSKNEIVSLLIDESINEELFKAADRVRKKYVTDEVHLRGLIEFSNICRCNCQYCGLRKDNKNAQRYRMDFEEIIKLTKSARDYGYKTIVLQSGEDAYFTKEKMCEIEEAAKRLRPKTEQGKSFSQEEYFNSGIERKPLLMIHPVCLDPKDDEEKVALIKEQPNLLVGLSIGIPSINGRKKESYRYRINLIKWRELLEIDDDYFEETGNEEET